MRWLLAIGPLLAATLATANSINGELSLTLEGAPLQRSESSAAVVYFRPTTPVTAQPLAEQTMATVQKRFEPATLAITPGTPVRFPNLDPILHNAFSTNPRNAFDTGIYGGGESAVHIFENPGLVRVFCNVHHEMYAHIVVLDTPFFVQPDRAGRFTIDDLPEGPGELFAWHERGKLWRQKINIENQQSVPVAIEMAITRPRVPAHRDKDGRNYKSRRLRQRSGY